MTLSGTQPNYSVTGMPKGTHAIVYRRTAGGNITEKTSVCDSDRRKRTSSSSETNIVMSLTEAVTEQTEQARSTVGR
ncbi:MAG: hypothetical protein U0T36_04160 [Saprospiraceae bacterium]